MAGIGTKHSFDPRNSLPESCRSKSYQQKATTEKRMPPAKGEAGGKVSTGVETHALGRRSVECSQYRLFMVLNIGETLKIVSDFVLLDWGFCWMGYAKGKAEMKRAIWADTFLV
jgi:hypothetical protein